MEALDQQEIKYKVGDILQEKFDNSTIVRINGIVYRANYIQYYIKYLSNPSFYCEHECCAFRPYYKLEDQYELCPQANTPLWKLLNE